jgi:choline-phosphate cytidylyltransferase
MQGKHVLCESPLTLNLDELNELREIADSKELILMEALKTAYATAYKRLLLLVKSGKIGDVVSIDATCTSLINEDMDGFSANNPNWDCIYEWGPTALLPIFQLLGKDYHNDRIVVRYRDSEKQHDGFIKGELVYRNSIASFMIANDVKSEGSLIISGTNGYIYVPSPWWKTDYFEIRYENPIENKRYFYQLDGEGIRYEFVAFVRAIEKGKQFMDIDGNISESIVKFMQEYVEGRNIIEIE